jgi:NAD-dependent deacetylase
LVSRTQPHSGHFAITELSKVVGERPDGNGKFTLITQNVDDLHERAGFADALHVHGSLFEPRCSACGNSSAFLAEPPLEAIEHIEPPLCTRCGGYVRPGVVWFGESLPTRLWHQSVRAVQECEVLLVVGTSGVVHPIADLPSMARKSGAWVCEINPQATQITHVAQHSWRESAAVGLPLLLQDWPCP